MTAAVVLCPGSDDGRTPPFKRGVSFPGPEQIEPGVPFGPDGSYMLGELLGQGSFAKVHGCTLGKERKLAVKIVNIDNMKFMPDFADQEKLLEREVQILRSLRHERIVNLHEFFSADKYWFLVMELVGGGELFHQIPVNRGLPDLEAKYIFVQLLEGIGYIHSKDVIHRDLKPENILIAHSRNAPPPDVGILRDVKIADFGLGKFASSVDSPVRSCVGSPVYAAPEVMQIGCMGGTYDKAVDLWSLGAVLYVTLCGMYPFTGRSIPRNVMLGSVTEIYGMMGPAVATVSLHLRNGLVRSYGAGGDDAQGPWVLDDDEAVTAVSQEARQDLLGNALTFYSSKGKVCQLVGAQARKVGRFSAKPGSQICGLRYTGSQLCGVDTMPVDRSQKGVVASISGWCGTSVDGAEFQLRDGSTLRYGGAGGTSVGPWVLDADERLIFAEQERSESFLGNSLVLMTSKGRVISMRGTSAAETVHFAVASGVAQIDRLRFEGSRLVDVESPPADQELASANFRMDTPNWSRTSDAAKAMVRGLLQVSPAKRMCMADCLRCPWIAGGMMDSPKDAQDVSFFVRKGSKPEAIAKAADMAAEAHDESVMAEQAATTASASRIGAVRLILGRADSAVDQVQLQFRSRPEPVSYGGAGGNSVGPWALQPSEFIIGVLQEQREPPNCYLGNLLAFFTSLGGVITVAGESARPRQFFGAAHGQQIRGLSFEGPRLTGINLTTVAPTGNHTAPEGLVAEVSWRADAAVDEVGFHFRDGSRVAYGGQGGDEQGPFVLQPQELLVAVTQEYTGQYLGNSLVFLTSLGNVLTLAGSESRRSNCFAVASGLQVVGLQWQHDSGQLVGVECGPAEKW